MGPFISIITVSFNSEKTIERTLKSVAAQTYKNVEHIVIDGASTEGNRSRRFRELHFVTRQAIEDFQWIRRGTRLARDVFGFVKQCHCGPSGQGEQHSP
jgi:GT2 family glycosyltransferase